MLLLLNITSMLGLVWLLSVILICSSTVLTLRNGSCSSGSFGYCDEKLKQVVNFPVRMEA